MEFLPSKTLSVSEDDGPSGGLQYMSEDMSFKLSLKLD